MMRLLTGLLTLTLAAGSPALAQRPQTVEPGAFETIQLNGEGRAVLRFTASAPGLPAFDLMAAPDGLDSVSLSAVAEDESKVAADLVVLPPGRHDLVLQAGPRADGQAMEIQGRLRLDPPYDGFEPNDSREMARGIELPFYQMIRLAQGDEDWFRVDETRGGVIGIHLHHAFDGYVGPRITVFDADGAVIIETVDNPYSWRSMRYVRADGRPIWIRLTDSSAWGENYAAAFKALEIVHYLPDAPVNGTLVTLGVEADDPSFYQLDLVGEALGSRVRSAGQADEVASELARAVERRQLPAWLFWLMAALLAVGLVGAGYWNMRRAKPSG